MSEERDDIAELVENLRDMAPPRSAPFPNIAHIYEVAADVIEELQKELAASREWEEEYMGNLVVMCRWHEKETARADISQARLSEAVKVLEEASGKIDMQDVRLAVGEGKLTARDIINGVNAVLSMRRARSQAFLATIGEEQ